MQGLLTRTSRGKRGWTSVEPIRASAWALLFAASLTPQLLAQPAPADPVTMQKIEEARQNGIPMAAGSVDKEVTVEAVLLPFVDSKRIFGKEIASNYVIIHLTISNKSREAALIVHSAFIDYSRWGLSGASVAEPDPRPKFDLKAAPPTDLPGDADHGRQAEADDRQERWHSRSRKAQISSTESRLVRGQLFDKRPSTVRNLVVGGLRLAGTVASGYAYTLSEQGYIRGIGTFNGNVLPGLEVFWGDATIEQANRISDLGFRVNKVIPKEASDIVVAFFPIDRFLTPGLKKLFLKSPALFFSPNLLAMDPEAFKLIRGPLLHAFPDKTQDQLIRAERCSIAYKDHPDLLRKDKDCKGVAHLAVALGHFLAEASLNNVEVVVGGILVVDIDNVAATIEAVEFTGDNGAPTVWNSGGPKEGVIRGRFLSGAVPVIENAQELGIADLAAGAEGSTPERLNFTLNVTEPVKLRAGDNILRFRADKTNQSGNTVHSMVFEKVVNFQATAPSISSVALTGSKVTITGSGFENPPKDPLQIEFHSEGHAAKPAGPAKRTPTQIEFDLPADLEAACWSVALTIGGRPATVDAGVTPVAKSPSPVIQSAVESAGTITVTGSEFVDLEEGCGVSLKAQLIAEGATEPALEKSPDSPTSVTFEKPAEPAGAKWLVRIVVNGTQAAQKEVTAATP